MEDFTRKSDFNQKRRLCVAACQVSGEDIIKEGWIVNLPSFVLVTGVQVVLLGGINKAGGKVKLSVGADVEQVEINGNANTVVDVSGLANKYYPSGARVSIANGSTALDAGDNAGEIIIFVEYIEQHMTTGAYTN